MSKVEKLLGAAIGIAMVIAIGLVAHSLGGVADAIKGSAKFGAVSPSDNSATNFTEVTASNGLAVGTSQQFQVSSAGALTTSGLATIGTFTQGGGIRATSTANSSETMLASDFDTENMVYITPTVQSTTETLPATSTLTSFIPTAGQCRLVEFVNGTSTAGITVTLAAGTGINLRKATTTLAVLPGGIDAVNFCRKTNTDIDAILTAGI